MDPINRRSFLGGMGLTATGAMGSLPVAADGQQSAGGRPRTIVKQPLDVKLNVKQAYAAWIYDGVWEGPCRPNINTLPNLSRAEQLENNRKQFAALINRSRRLFDPYTHVMAPAFLDYYMPNEFGEKELKRLETDAQDVDVYLVWGNKHPQNPTCLIGERFGKPAMLMGFAQEKLDLETAVGIQNARDVAAFFRSRGMPGYGPLTIGGVLDVLKLMWAKKAFQNLKLLYITNREGRVGRISMSNVHNWEDIQHRYGIRMQIATYGELAKEIDRIRGDKEMQAESRRLAEQQTVTFARTDPLLSKILIVKGEIARCIGHDKPGCSLQVHCTVPNTQELHEKAQDYGFHFAMAVGDHAKKVGALADMLGMKAVFHNA